MKKYYTITIVLIVSLFIISAQQQHPFYMQDYTTQDKWVDSIYTNMTQKERIGQLFNVAAYSNQDSTHIREIKQLIKNYHIGGLTFFQGAPTKQAELTNAYQKLSKVPLLIAMDAEWGLGMSQNALKILKDDAELEKFKLGAKEQALEFDINKIVPVYEFIYQKAFEMA